jgi:hypothetical protein
MKSVWAKRLNQALLVLTAAVMLDTCVFSLRTSPRVFRVAAGKTIPISGQLDGRIAPSPTPGSIFGGNRISDPAVLNRLLVVEPLRPELGIQFVERNGRIWRARLQVQPGAREGVYPIHVLQAGEPPGENNLYRVQVFADAAAKRRADPSFSGRYLGIAPWWVALTLVPPILAMLVLSWRTSRRREQHLLRRGIGVIYKLARRKDHWELIAGLGTADGIQVGDHVWLLSRDLDPVAAIRVDHAGPRHLTATIDLEVPASPDGHVCRMADALPPHTIEKGERQT